MGDKKMGRPTDNPKPYHMTVKYDEECKEILEQYCKQEQVPRMEAARRGIKKLKDEYYIMRQLSFQAIPDKKERMVQTR